MKLGVAERMAPCDNWENDEVGQGAISGVQVHSIISTPTIDDSDLDVAEHDDDCSGCALCRPARTRRSQARRVSKLPFFRERV